MPNSATDFQSYMDEWTYANGRPAVTGLIKQQPEHFCVREQMEVVPTGEGEHIWLLIRKTKQNTDQVAKQLARFAEVAYRDVGYSGLKDFNAVTEQWFSVYLPGRDELNWSVFEMTGVEILKSTRHARKLKRGTHRANHFTIELCELSGNTEGLSDKLKTIEREGVPNYFGSQRFGRGAGNISQAIEMFENNKKIRNRNLRGILLSSARSWLFNEVLSERIEHKTWNRLWSGEPANLDGTASIFRSGDVNDDHRLRSLDIHPTAPLWGKVKKEISNAYIELHRWEKESIGEFAVLSDGLECAGLEYRRRPTRMRAKQLEWQLEGNRLSISFGLQRGQFATSLLRELICERTN